MKRWAIVLAATLAMLGLSACGNDDQAPEASPAGSSEPPGASTNGSDGRIVFQRYDPADRRSRHLHHEPRRQRRAPALPRRALGGGSMVTGRHRDPDQLLRRRDGGASDRPSAPVRCGRCAPPDPDLETYCGGAWSPDGERLACEGYGIDDRGLNGIYSIRVSDGGDLTRITSNADGYDTPGDYSPDGTRMVFVRVDDDENARLFVTDVDGTGVHKISGDLVDELSPGRWSPTGDQILFAARRARPSQDDLGRERRRQLAARAADRSDLRRSLVGPGGRGLLLAGVVAGRDEDRVRAVDPGRGGRGHLHRERRREWFGPGDGR